MKLTEAVERLADWGEGTIICVKRPWTPTAECIVVVPDENLGVPQATKANGYDYFLETQIAKEVLTILRGEQTIIRMTDLLIFYAENDAYPNWAYE